MFRQVLRKRSRGSWIGFCGGWWVSWNGRSICSYFFVLVIVVADFAAGV